MWMAPRSPAPRRRGKPGGGDTRRFAWDRRRRLREFRGGSVAGVGRARSSRVLTVVSQSTSAAERGGRDADHDRRGLRARRRRRGGQTWWPVSSGLGRGSCRGAAHGRPVPGRIDSRERTLARDHLGSASLALADRRGAGTDRVHAVRGGEPRRGDARPLPYNGKLGTPRPASTTTGSPYRPWAGRFVVAEDWRVRRRNAYGYVGGNPLTMIARMVTRSSQAGLQPRRHQAYMAMKTPVLPFILVRPDVVRIARSDRRIRCDFCASSGSPAAGRHGHRDATIALDGCDQRVVLAGYATFGLLAAAPEGSAR